MIPDLAAHVVDLTGRLGAAASDRQVYGHVPEEPLVPCMIVQGAEDVIQADPDATGAGEYLVTLDVVLLVELDDEHDNADATTALWSSLAQLATVLEDRDCPWWLVQVSQPGTLQTTYWQHHGVTATVRTRT